MPKDKDRSTINPAQQQRKLEKAKALKKGKAELQARRNEKLARRNPDRLQRQVDDLKALEESGSIRPREKQVLEELQKDLRAVRKAREALGEKPHQSSNRHRQAQEDEEAGRGDRRRDGILGKRKWNRERRAQGDQDQQSSGSETDESVRRIPMPQDTPPPIRPRRNDQKGTNANAEPLASSRGGERQPDQVIASQVVAQPKVTYESAPQIRNLQKEVVGRFVPTVVRQKQDAVKGTGRLVEPEEFDRLQKEGYIRQSNRQSIEDSSHATSALPPSTSVGNAPALDPGTGARSLAEEEERFRREMMQARVEEVQDDDL